jgi:hypothetical protein
VSNPCPSQQPRARRSAERTGAALTWAGLLCLCISAGLFVLKGREAMWISFGFLAVGCALIQNIGIPVVMEQIAKIIRAFRGQNGDHRPPTEGAT